MSNEEIIQAIKKKYVAEFGSLRHNDDQGYFLAGFVATVLEEIKRKSKSKMLKSKK